MKNKNGSLNIVRKAKSCDNITVAEVTMSILECMADLSRVSNAFDTEIKKSLGTLYGKQIEEIIKGVEDVVQKVKEIVPDIIEDNLYDSGFTQI